jgi:hypothetical protein
MRIQHYNNINVEQLLSHIYVQDWNNIYDTSDPEQQIQHFNSIIRWLLEIHAPLREYVKRNKVNPWYNCDVERAIVKREPTEFGSAGKLLRIDQGTKSKGKK